MKILLIQPPHSGRRPDLVPLGLCYIADSILEAGHNVSVLDIYAMGYSEDAVIKLMPALDADVFAIGAFSTQYRYVKWLIAKLREYHGNKSVIIGGPLASFNAELVIRNAGADICVFGEGDITIKNILNNLDNLDNVKGICFRQNNGNIRRNPPQDELADVDIKRFPPYGLFPLDIYFRHMHVWGVNSKRARTINMITARGCPYECNFCSRVFKKTRLRSIGNIAKEIAQLKERYSITGIVFCDELAVVSKSRAYELCDIMKGFGLEWGCQGRVNIVDTSLLRHMKRCGCRYVGYGVESGSQKILNLMNKRSEVSQNEKAIIETTKAGMYPVVQMIFGYPGEDVSTINETIDFFKRAGYSPPTPFSEPELSLITPLPGTSLYDTACKKGFITNEEEYLLNIEHGYQKGCPVLVNFTEFDNSTLLRLKKDTENQIYFNYIRFLKKHPLRYFRFIFTRIIWRLQGLWFLIETEGYLAAFRKVSKKIADSIKKRQVCSGLRLQIDS